MLADGAAAALATGDPPPDRLAGPERCAATAATLEASPS